MILDLTSPTPHKSRPVRGAGRILSADQARRNQEPALTACRRRGEAQRQWEEEELPQPQVFRKPRLGVMGQRCHYPQVARNGKTEARL
jgi:hypothetical protein